MTVNIEDITRLAVELNALDENRGWDEALKIWLRKEQIPKEVFREYLSASMGAFIENFEDESKAAEDLMLHFITQVGQSFRLGWEAHKQYGNHRR